MGIDELRARIDEIDEQIVQLIKDRAEQARGIGALKREQNVRVYAPQREQEIIRRVSELAEGAIAPEALRAIYAEIMSACRAVERQTRVAFLGPAGTFTQQAARKQFGSSVDYLPANGIDGVFAEVDRGDADYGVVPVETFAEGGLNETLDMFIDSSLKVCGEIQLRIHHHLMANGPREAVQRIYSRPQVFSQCKAWLATNFPKVALQETASTTEAARVAQSEPAAAAIAHQEAAKLYQLDILFQNIEDSPHNATRFFVLGCDFPDPSGHDKTGLLCFIKDEVGALYHLLGAFHDQDINLTYIQSLPSKRKAWDYCFFIVLQGHSRDANVKAALETVAERCKEIKLLGSYPAAEE